MNAVILDGSYKGDDLTIVNKTIISILSAKNWSVEHIVLHEKNIAPCLGCFKCWVKTPGVCTINDYGRKVAEMAVTADLLVSVTPIVFGGYSSELKKAMDRMIPIVSPFFEKINGETHHIMRYEKYPVNIMVGTSQEVDEQKTFAALVRRNGINMQDLDPVFSILDSLQPEDVEENINQSFNKARI